LRLHLVPIRIDIKKTRRLMTPRETARVAVELVDFGPLRARPGIGEGRRHFGNHVGSVGKGVAVFLKGEFEVYNDGAVDLIPTVLAEM